jgi:hypothetical protein
LRADELTAERGFTIFWQHLEHKQYHGPDRKHAQQLIRKGTWSLMDGLSTTMGKIARTPFHHDNSGTGE